MGCSMTGSRILLASCLLTAACNAHGEHAAVATSAPTTDWRPGATSLRIIIDSQGIQIGSLDGPEAIVFGEITDARLAAGHLAILDRRSTALRLFSHAGKFQHGVSRPGVGPGELARPIALARGTGELLVLDQATQVVNRFREAGDSLIYSGYTPLQFTGFDACGLGDRVVVLGYDGKYALHEISLNTGNEVASFGGTWGPSHPILKRSLTRGQVSCDAQARLIVAGSDLIPEVRAFDLNGQPRWTFAIPDFVVVKMDPTSDGGVMYSTPKVGYYDQVVSVVSLGAGVTLLQYGRMAPDVKTQYPTELTTLLLDSIGREVDRQTGIARVLFATDGQLITGSEEPFPRLEVRSFTLGDATK